MGKINLTGFTLTPHGIEPIGYIKDDTMDDLTIVIPAHNEEDNIKSIIERCQGYADGAHIIVVCDHCTDNTRIYAQMYDEVEVIELLDDMKGFKGALIMGGLCARTKYLVFVMADNCDELLILPNMRHILESGFDIVCASRHMVGGKVYKPNSNDKHLASWLVSALARILVGVPTWDSTNAYKMWRTSVWRKSLHHGGMKDGGFECNMLWMFKAYFDGKRIKEIPTTWFGREAGESKFKFIRQAPAYIKVLLQGVYWRLKRGAKAIINGGKS